MGSSCLRILSLLLLILSIGISASSFISDDVFGSHASAGRNLLQAKKACPVNFEFLNYTIITSQCRGPQYPPKPCCASFLEFACPYTDQLNDLSNDCSTIMFNYINLYGNYTPGLFASSCRGDKQGLPCPATPPTTSVNDSSRGLLSTTPHLLMLTAAFLVVLLRWL